MIKKFFKQIFQLFLRILSLLKWPFAIIFLGFGAMLGAFFLKETIFCKPEVAEVAVSLNEKYNSTSNLVLAQWNWIPPRDGGIGIPMPGSNYHARTGGMDSICPAEWSALLIFQYFVIFILSISFIAISYSIFLLPKVTIISARACSLSVWSLLLVTQIIPWVLKAASPPIELMIGYHLFVGGTLIWLILKIKKIINWNEKIS